MIDHKGTVTKVGPVHDALNDLGLTVCFIDGITRMRVPDSDQGIATIGIELQTVESLKQGIMMIGLPPNQGPKPP